MAVDLSLCAWWPLSVEIKCEDINIYDTKTSISGWIPSKSLTMDPEGNFTHKSNDRVSPFWYQGVQSEFG